MATDLTAPRENRPSPRALDLEATSAAGLEAILQRGVPPDPAALAGWEFRGINTPRLFKLLGLKKFIKGFWRDRNGAVWGYNTPAVQNGTADGWFARPSDAAPKRFGFYRVDPVDRAGRDSLYPNALLLDYGKGGNPDITAALRDYLVQIDSGDIDLLLGKAYLAIGPLRLPTFTFFILERFRSGPAWP